MSAQVMSRELLDQFSELVTETGCRLWTGCMSSGYGVIRAQGKLWRAHIASMLLTGQQVEGKCVLHKCDTPACINPGHLFLGTRADNAMDRDRKGRVAHGAKHYATKLTPEQVQRIREDVRPQNVIAKAYGVRQDHVSRIKSGRARRRG